MKHLKLNDFKKIYRLVKTGAPPVDFLILGLLVWIEEAYIEYKVDKEVDTAIDQYLKDAYCEDQDWHKAGIIKEEWNDTGVPLPTLSVTHPAVEKSETPQRPQDRN